MPLCQLCTTIDFTAPPQRSGVVFRSWRESYPLNHDIFYYSLAEGHTTNSDDGTLLKHCESIDALESSAKTCNLCWLIKNCVDATLVNLHKARKMDFDYEVSGYQFLLWQKEGVEGSQVLGLHPNPQIVSEDAKEYLVMGGIRLCTEHDSSLQSLFTGRRIVSSPTSAKCQSKIKGWIKECRELHNHQINFKVQLPTRVLDIQHEGHKVLLWETKDAEGEYAALSHCWGGFMPYTLTKETFKELTTGVDTNNLPQSFQDAIWVAFQLGIRYLWIDSLCILQDDANDWAHESERMTEVYRNSYLTISASCAANSADGFLGNRSLPTHVPIPIRDTISSSLKGEAIAFTILPRHVVDDYLITHLADEPLNARGWALQERYLSRRTLQFTRSQVYFECDQGFYSEDGRDSRRSEYKLKENMINSVLSWKTWNNIVIQYSRRKLTMEDDKLPALAGLAKHFAGERYSLEAFSMSKSHYLAGLWSGDIVSGLMWEVDRGYDKPRQRPQKYRAPTWSWACIDAPISFSLTYSNTELVVIEDAHTDLDTPQSPYGKVTEGWICCHALKFRPLGYHGNGPLDFDEDGTKFYIFVTWDAEEYCIPERGEIADPTKGESELFAIPLAWQGVRSDDPTLLFGPFFVIVKAASRQVPKHHTLPHFERVGAGSAQWYQSPMGLKRLVQDKWTAAKESGNLERLILL